jgi:hypothetical protein
MARSIKGCEVGTKGTALTSSMSIRLLAIASSPFPKSRQEDWQNSSKINALGGILGISDHQFWNMITDSGNPEKVIE